MRQLCGNGLSLRQRKVRVRRYTDSNRPHLKFVVNYREAGKRKRSFFETKGQAEAFAAFKNAELRKHGIAGSEFSSRLREMAQECTERLSAFGKTLTDATDFFVAHLKASKGSITASELVPQLIAAKEADGIEHPIRRGFAVTASPFRQEVRRTKGRDNHEQRHRQLVALTQCRADHAQQFPAHTRHDVQPRDCTRIRDQQSCGEN
jgi:hypothetical protein